MSDSIQWVDLWRNVSQECFTQRLFCTCWMNNSQYLQLMFQKCCVLTKKKLFSVMLKQHSVAFRNFCVEPVMVRLVCEDTCSSRVNDISFIEIDGCMRMCALVLLWTGGCCHAIWVPCSARWADIQQPVRHYWQIRDWTGPQGVSVHRSAIIALRKPIHQLQTRDLVKHSFKMHFAQ